MAGGRFLGKQACSSVHASEMFEKTENTQEQSVVSGAELCALSRAAVVGLGGALGKERS